MKIINSGWNKGGTNVELSHRFIQYPPLFKKAVHLKLESQ